MSSLFEQLESRLAATEKRLAEMERRMREQMHMMAVHRHYTKHRDEMDLTGPIPLSEYDSLPEPQPEPARDPYAELKAAHAAGKVIEYNASDSDPEWYDCPNPKWNPGSQHRYRIKPDIPAAEVQEWDKSAGAIMRLLANHPNYSPTQSGATSFIANAIIGAIKRDEVPAVYFGHPADAMGRMRDENNALRREVEQDERIAANWKAELQVAHAKIAELERQIRSHMDAIEGFLKRIDRDAVTIAQLQSDNAKQAERIRVLEEFHSCFQIRHVFGREYIVDSHIGGESTDKWLAARRGVEK